MALGAIEFALVIYLFYRARADFQAILIFIASIVGFVNVLRGEQIEVYPEEIVFRTGWLGFVRTRRVAASDVLGVEWVEGALDEVKSKEDEPDCIKFFLPNASINAARTIDFEDYTVFRKQIAALYPDMEKRWSSGAVRSSEFTLLNLS